MVALSLGLVLLVAAGLKFKDPAWEPFGRAFIVPPRVRVLLIEIELCVGVWLASGAAAALLRPVAAVYFAVLACVSLFLGLQGQPSCGCFGQVSVSPWTTLGLDVAAAVVLLAVRPRGIDHSLGASIRRHGALIGWTTGGLVMMAAVAVGLYGGIGPAWASLLGDVVTAEPAVSDLGERPDGAPARFAVTLRNHLARPIRVLGGTSDCSCAAAEDLPVTLPPFGSAQVHVAGAFKGKPGPFLREFVFYTDAGSGHHVTARFRGSVLPDSDSRTVH
jgi:hypothetical protein